MKSIINRLIQHEQLNKNEAYEILTEIAKGKHNHNLISSFLTIYMMRSISLNELEGFRQALLELCISVDLSDYQTIDLCGTGGDGKDTFNISTLSSFIVAGSGIKVSKHGNYGVSSGCGSSNVLEFLGVKFSNNESFIKKTIEKSGICFLHAPLFHPAMKNVAPIRKELGLKTFFNILGPLVNPSSPKYQLTGVFNLEIARLYGYLFQKTNQNYTILYSLDGYDEISLTTQTKVIQKDKELLISPIDFGVNKVNSNQIIGGNDIKSSANIFLNILNGKGSSAQINVVCANAGMAISTVENLSPKEGFEKAKESLNSGKAKEAFEKIVEISKNG
jgi:anthranilate phosphoribosyltransferase